MVNRYREPAAYMQMLLKTGKAKCYCCDVTIVITRRYKFTNPQGQWRVWCGNCYDKCRIVPDRIRCHKKDLI